MAGTAPTRLENAACLMSSTCQPAQVEACPGQPDRQIARAAAKIENGATQRAAPEHCSESRLRAADIPRSRVEIDVVEEACGAGPNRLMRP